MKIILPKEMARIEGLAYAAGASEEQFMEEAGKSIAEKLLNHFDLPEVTLLCAKGNNSGDAYVAGRYLLKAGVQVQAKQLVPLSESSPLCQKMAERFKEVGGRFTTEISGFLLDGLFGTGFRGAAEGDFAATIREANESGLPIVAIDIPSGLNGATGEVAGVALKADLTIFLGLPKRGFFLDQGPNYTGELVGRDFGLGQIFIDQAMEEGVWIRKKLVAPHLPTIERLRDKYQAGHLLMVAGSPGMAGAAILSSHAALRSGAGLVRLFHPPGMEEALATAPVEVVKHLLANDSLQSWLDKAGALLIGPGIGREEKTGEFFTKLLSHSLPPLLLDADALYWLAEKSLPPPKGSLLTPHQGELARLLGSSRANGLTADLATRCQAYAEKHEITLLVKGAATHIFHPDEPVFISTFGDPGMATAGSGDVLSGIIAALLAQGVDARWAAALGCTLHGIAGEVTAGERTSYSMIASDLIEALPFAFDELLQEEAR